MGKRHVFDSSEGEFPSLSVRRAEAGTMKGRQLLDYPTGFSHETDSEWIISEVSLQGTGTGGTGGNFLWCRP